MTMLSSSWKTSGETLNSPRNGLSIAAVRKMSRARNAVKIALYS